MGKLFSYCGVTTKKGQVKVRFCNDLVRVKVLDKDGDQNINFIELPRAMTKPECVKHLQTVDMYALPENKVAIDDAVEKYNPSPVVKSTKKVSSKKTVVSSSEKMADLKSRAALAVK
jgi:hypothetical protein